MSGADRSVERPKIHVERTSIDVALGTLALMGFVGGLAAVLFVWPELPERLPIHFDLSGNPDRWGPRWELFVPMAISAVLGLGLEILSYFPQSYNYLTEITAENAQRQYRLAVRLLRSLNAIIQWLFAAVAWTILRAAQGLSHPGMWLIPAFVAGTFVLLIVYLLNAHTDPTTRRSA